MSGKAGSLSTHVPRNPHLFMQMPPSAHLFLQETPSDLSVGTQPEKSPLWLSIGPSKASPRALIWPLVNSYCLESVRPGLVWLTPQHQKPQHHTACTWREPEGSSADLHKRADKGASKGYAPADKGPNKRGKCLTGGHSPFWPPQTMPPMVPSRPCAPIWTRGPPKLGSPKPGHDMV